MTDQTIHDVTDDDRRIARDWAEFVESSPDTWTGSIRVAALVILNDIPAPAPPTLADMTANERTECRRMQADVKGYEHRAVIIQPYLSNGTARVMWETLRIEAVPWENITPRPDLPRFVWPGDTPAPAPPSTLAEGSKRDNDAALRVLPVHRTEAGHPNCSACDGGGCPDCTDPA